MAIISWQRQINSKFKIQNSKLGQGSAEAMRRVMDSIFEDMSTVRQPQMVAFKPAVELQDKDEALVLRAQIPGINARDLDVRVTKQAVVISGEKSDNNQTEKIGYFRSEFTYGKFQRVIQLPVAIQNDKVQAEYKNGILSLTLPKASKASNQVVKVNLLANTASTTQDIPAIESAETTPTPEVSPVVQEPQTAQFAEETHDVWAA
ncbi:MAG: Hsp20/alpha crystallin family protein [Scytonematopsis contorta HA4267-MV1]|nr:Hsp20/alpha crystallin family protein [Scytonematopsis contorta HA4267-MV1]